DYYKIAPRYGTNEDAKELFAEAHKRGIKILLDLVPGHSSDKHKWFEASKQPERNEFSDRYIWTGNAFDYPEGYRLMSGMSDRDGNYMVNFFNSQPALNYGFEKRDHAWQLPPDHPSCRATLEEMKRIMRFWLDMGCDGFRVDMAYSLVKNDPEKTGTKRLWQEVRSELDRDYPEAAILAEWSCAEAAIDAGFHMDFYIHFGSVGYNALFQTEDFDYVDRSKAVKCFFKEDGEGDITAFLDEFLRKYHYINGRGYMCLPTGNHDMIRYSRRRSEEELKLVASFILLMPTIPFVYYGDEIGMKYAEGLHSKEGGFFRTGSRTPMQWTDGKNKGFSETDGALYLPVDLRKDAPNVEEQEKRKDSLLNTIRAFTELRAAEKDLQAGGEFEVVYGEEREYPFVFRRGKFLIAVNPSGKEAKCAIPAGNYKKRLAIGDGAAQGGQLTIKKLSLVVFEKE
ncbi:MAG: glycosylase, partial [Clostridiales bacterium]|nr:glycosylase [Clostridiales bacterium]